MVVKQKGFSLIEVMIALAIIVIIAGIATPIYSSYLTRAKIATALTDLDGVKNSISNYISNHGTINGYSFQESKTYN